jgi:adenylate cyclase
VLGFGLAWTTLAIDALSLKLVTAAVALAETAALSWALFLFGAVWPPFTALAAGALACGFGLAYSVSGPGRRKRALVQGLGGRVSRETFERLLSADTPLPHAGAEREASVVVCRLLNRRELAETLDAADFVALSNAFAHAASQTLLDAGGVLTEGDGKHVEAGFGVPLPDPAHAVQAVLAAFALGRRMEDFRRECAERWNVEPDCRIAVNAGALIAGTFGSGTLAGFGVAGDALDFCRQLCRLNTTYGTRILAGPEVFRLAHAAVEMRPVDLLWDRAGKVRLELYELLGPQGALPAEALQRRDAFWIAVILFRAKQDQEAAALFWTLLQDDSGAKDPLIQYYLDRLQLTPQKPLANP